MSTARFWPFERDDLLRLAEIDPAGQFAHDDDVEPLDHLALERRGVGERRIADRGPQVGEQAEILAQAQQARLGPHVVGDLVPFGPADRADQHRIRRLGRRSVLVGDRGAMSVVGTAADEVALGLEGGEADVARSAGKSLGLGHHFGADAVAGQEQKLVGHWSCPWEGKSDGLG